ncbi:hypothetical protein [Pedobacter xixiisoli]|uniref:Uncharacterized protein n=1 Tax=Pedobacter xixiisoli TaxID=1476464 RepID=A0A285ZQ15_9SPHI|nr:hypothetical protein [Pedobacter xixiisoli]SOD11734.1 hypothetical protein SAMN06297358_0307 [Pedobacter xixiisoli]
MNIKDFFSGIIKPNPTQNEEIKNRLKETFLKATNKIELDDIIILYGNFEGEAKVPFVKFHWANSYIIGFNSIGTYLSLVPFKNDFSQFGEPINLLPNNLQRLEKSFVAQGYVFVDKHDNSFTMNVAKYTGNLTALLSQNQIAVDQEKEVEMFSDFYNLIKK